MQKGLKQKTLAKLLEQFGHQAALVGNSSSIFDKINCTQLTEREPETVLEDLKS